MYRINAETTNATNTNASKANSFEEFISKKCK